MLKFVNFTLLWLSTIQTDLDLSNLHSNYWALSNLGRDLLPLEILIKEVFDRL